jgi:DNA-directed RNA polymerase specialized sigma24 family protein
MRIDAIEYAYEGLGWRCRFIARDGTILAISWPFPTPEEAENDLWQRSSRPLKELNSQGYITRGAARREAQRARIDIVERLRAEGLSYAEIGRLLGVTRQRVHHLSSKRR